MTRVFAGLLFVLLLAGQVLADPTGRVSWIYDGDTLKVEGIGKVRLLGIDAPEHEDSYRDRFYRR
ncbi:MAG: thermonuclease family protein, partial [Deltaproteobacteria bacterium]